MYQNIKYKKIGGFGWPPNIDIYRDMALNIGMMFTNEHFPWLKKIALSWKCFDLKYNNNIAVIYFSMTISVFWLSSVFRIIVISKTAARNRLGIQRLSNAKVLHCWTESIWFQNWIKMCQILRLLKNTIQIM